MPDNNGTQDQIDQPPTGLKLILREILAGAAGRTGPTSAFGLGVPQAEGLTPQETQLLASLGVARRKIDTQEKGLNLKALLSEHAEQGRSKDRDIKIFDVLNKALTIQSQVGSQLAEGGGNDANLMLKYMRDVLGEQLGKSVGAKPQTNKLSAAARTKKYSSPAEVKDAFRKGLLSQEDAVNILKTQFKMQ